jgi:ureidoglycolate hydrolase
MTLISQRRLGKTGLVFRLFDELAETHPEVHCVYLDIFASRNLDDFIKLFSEAAMRSFQPKTPIGERLLNYIKSFSPIVTYDSLTAQPQLLIDYHTNHEKEYTLRGLFDFLDGQKVPIIVAIDEFQQIREYPEKNMEALLRTYIQQYKNLNFIFSGSKMHIMADIFANERKPFYSSTAFVSLDKISEESYSIFIRKLFGKGGRNITDEAVQFILEWTQRVTYYTQQLCHAIFANGNMMIDLAVVKLACDQILKQGETVYLQYRQMLTDKQWNYLIAVAKEGSVRQITAADFLKRYQIGGASASRQMSESLTEKGLLNAEVSLEGIDYSVSDVFFSHWLERI